MFDNSVIQAAIITKLKAATALATILGGANTEIREDQWQGTRFVYPAVRVELGTQIPNGETNCTAVNVPITVLCYSENSSSRQADQIAGVVSTILNKTSWSDIVQSVRFAGTRVTSQVPAVRRDERTWEAQVVIAALICPI